MALVMQSALMFPAPITTTVRPAAEGGWALRGAPRRDRPVAGVEVLHV
jgi:hypothetical protein